MHQEPQILPSLFKPFLIQSEHGLGDDTSCCRLWPTGNHFIGIRPRLLMPYPTYILVIKDFVKSLDVTKWVPDIAILLGLNQYLLMPFLDLWEEFKVDTHYFGY